MRRGGFSEEVAEEFATMQKAWLSDFVTKGDLNRQPELLLAHIDRKFAVVTAANMRWTLAVGAPVIAAESIIEKVF